MGAAVGLGLVADLVARRWFNSQIDWDQMLTRVTTFGWVQLVIVAVALIVLRRIILRSISPIRA